MKKYTFTLALVLLAGLVRAQSVAGPALTALLDKTLSEQFKVGAPGAVAFMARNGRVMYKKAFGMANLELGVPMSTGNVFRIASITKQFTAVAILQLMEAGKLNLQDDISRFIPEFTAGGHKISIEHLLTHTSGITDYTRMQDNSTKVTINTSPGDMINFLRNETLRFIPGAKWEYSNSNYFLLGYIIEKISGKTYGQYLEDAFFKPLGMSSSSYAHDTRLVKNRAYGYSKGDTFFENAPYISMSQPYAAGAILSTVDDLYKWHQAVHSGKLIKKESLERALTRYRLTDGEETSYGYGWRLGRFYEQPSIWHGGLINGFAAMEIYLPQDDVFVAVFSNCDANNPEDWALKMAAYAIGMPAGYQEIFVDSALLQRYAGVYENEKGEERVITVSGNKLYSRRGKAPALRVKAWQQDRFFFEDPLQTMKFTRNKSGEVEKLMIRARRGSEVWSKTSKSIPDGTEIKVGEEILQSYVGTYQVTPEFSFSVTKEGARLFLQASGQEKLEMAAETETGFFLKVNGAQIDFVKDASGRTSSAILKQGGRKTVANRIK